MLGEVRQRLGQRAGAFANADLADRDGRRRPGNSAIAELNGAPVSTLRRIASMHVAVPGQRLFLRQRGQGLRQRHAVPTSVDRFRRMNVSSCGLSFVRALAAQPGHASSTVARRAATQRRAVATRCRRLVGAGACSGKSFLGVPSDSIRLA